MIFALPFRTSNHQIVEKKTKEFKEFAFKALISI